uniref:HDC14369 n=1 Tax=Drosophila melanogaster TaxID=7227 RepID=Q6IJS4_DROME|nr:TPA_inf: HDC14369 [Drosophila melanogaster]
MLWPSPVAFLDFQLTRINLACSSSIFDGQCQLLKLKFTYLEHKKLAIRLIRLAMAADVGGSIIKVEVQQDVQGPHPEGQCCPMGERGKGFTMRVILADWLFVSWLLVLLLPARSELAPLR